MDTATLSLGQNSKFKLMHQYRGIMSQASENSSCMEVIPCTQEEKKVSKKRVRAFRARCFVLTHNGPFLTCEVARGKYPHNQRICEASTLAQMGAFCDQQGALRCRMQWEKGADTRRLHLQGFLEFKNPRDIKALRQQLIGYHIEKAMDKKAAIVYVFKPTTRIEGAFAHFEHGVFKQPIIDPLNGMELYEWQRELMVKLKGTCGDTRTVNWIVDDEGSSGKTALCKHLLLTRPNEVCYISVGKGTDLCFAISTWLDSDANDLRVLLMDVPRCVDGHISYATLEKVKDGLIFSGKYESKTNIFNSPHLVVFSNQHPDKTKMSLDRWQVREVSKSVEEMILRQKPSMSGSNASSPVMELSQNPKANEFTGWGDSLSDPHMTSEEIKNWFGHQ